MYKPWLPDALLFVYLFNYLYVLCTWFSFYLPSTGNMKGNKTTTIGWPHLVYMVHMFYQKHSRMNDLSIETSIWRNPSVKALFVPHLASTWPPTLFQVSVAQPGTRQSSLGNATHSYSRSVGYISLPSESIIVWWSLYILALKQLYSVSRLLWHNITYM
jgi:hypothetical protein